MVLKCREVCFRSETGNPSPRDVDEFTSAVDSMSHDALYTYVQNSINSQIVTMFKSLETVEELRNQAGMNERNVSLVEKETGILMRDINYTLEQKCSSIEGAGDGVFLNTPNSISPGTVVSLYPGLIHLREDLKDSAYFSSLLPDPDFMIMTRLDETLIDGRTASKVPANPYALGHLVNHCGADKKPNVIQVRYVGVDRIGYAYVNGSTLTE